MLKFFSPLFPLLCAPVLLASPAHAQWTGAGEIGAVSARGNTDTDNVNGKIDIAYQADEWKNSFYIAALYGSSDSVTSANRWETRWQADYNLTRKLYSFGGLRYERDHFGAFSYQEAAAAGIGYKFIDTEPTKLSAQIGAGIKRSEEQTLVKNEADEVIDRIEGDTMTSALVTMGGNFEHALTATTKIVDKLVVEVARDNTFMQNDLALQVAINSRFSLSVGYGVRKNTHPAPDSDAVDTITTLNLVYKLDH